MSATAIIVFREVLEAALVIGIVMAATRGLAGRGTWVTLGAVGGLACAGLVALFAGALARAAQGVGQELFNAAVLLTAVAMLGWHNVWMSRHGSELSRELKAVGAEVRAERRPVSVLAIVVGVAVLREGAEVVLFLYGIALAGGAGAAEMLAGGAIGLALGAVAGALIYFGLVRVAGRYLFAVTSALILFLAAGLAAQAGRFLNQAGYLPSLGRLWDSSDILSEDGPFGMMLHVLIGYVSRPDGIQAIFYLTTLVVIGGLMYLTRRRPVPSRPVAQR